MLGIISGLLFCIGLSLIFLFFYLLFKYTNTVVESFALICLAAAVYVIGYSFELQAESLRQAVFFIRLEYFGISFVSAFWLLLSVRLFYRREPSIKLKLLVLIIPVLTLFLILTNEDHHLFYTGITAVSYGEFSVVVPGKGLWYYVHVSFSYGAMLLGLRYCYLLFRKGMFQKRVEFLLVIAGALIPYVLEPIYFLGLSPYGLDMAPFGISVAACCGYLLVFRYNFFGSGGITRDFIFSEIGTGIIVVDRNNRLTDFNKAAQKVLDWLAIKNIGVDLTTVKGAEKFVNVTGDTFDLEVRENGNVKHYEFIVTGLKEANREIGSVFSMREITGHKKKLQELYDMASYDWLTGIFTRRRFMEEIEREIARVKRYNGCLAVLMMDVDHFKNVNDQFGHLAGDDVLSAIAKVCQTRLRKTDIIGRYGGEEFAILLPETSREDAYKVAEDIRAGIEEAEIVYDHYPIKVTVSIGVVTVDNRDNGEVVPDLETLIKFADKALYRAKFHGRNQVC